MPSVSQCCSHPIPMGFPIAVGSMPSTQPHPLVGSLVQIVIPGWEEEPRLVHLWGERGSIDILVSLGVCHPWGPRCQPG